jgi:16S rRNA pseudouridine516 synthase
MFSRAQLETEEVNILRGIARQILEPKQAKAGQGKNRTNKEKADMAKLTLDRILQSQGFGSRKYCRELIEDGEVSIGGEVVDDYRATPDTNGLVLTIFEEEWEYREHVYIAINKPQNIECSRKPSHHPGVLTLLPEQFTWRDVQPVGRLDHDTTGLLLMSDDGAFIHAQSSPKRHVPKVYAATTAEPVTEALIAQLKAGVQLHDEPAPLAATAAASWARTCWKSCWSRASTTRSSACWRPPAIIAAPCSVPPSVACSWRRWNWKKGSGLIWMRSRWPCWCRMRSKSGLSSSGNPLTGRGVRAARAAD